MTLLRRALFPAALVLLVIAQLAIVVPGLFHTRLWEDEAYNLTVALNMLAGHGYASDGILSGGQLLQFDPRISTGPTVLLPVTAMLATGIDPVLGGRIVMTVFYAALLAGLWLLGRRIAGRWGAVAAVAMPLALNLKQMPSPVQGPNDILGELPAAMFLIFAVYLYRRHPVWAGLMAGLAVQTKLIALLAVPAILAAVLLSEPGQRAGARVVRARVLRGLWCVLGVAVPTVLVELWKLIALGWPGYIAETRSLGAFIRDGGQAGYAESPVGKAVYLLHSWFVPVWAVLLVTAVAVVVAILAWRFRARMPRRELLLDLGVVVVASLIWGAWWLLSVHTPAWIRYPAPAIVAFGPVVAAAFVVGIRALWRRGSGAGLRGAGLRGARLRGASGARWLAGAASGIVVVVLVAQAALHGVSAWSSFWDETLPQQRAAAADVAALGATTMQSYWGPGVSLVVMAGAHSRLHEANQPDDAPMVFFSYALTPAQRAAFDRSVNEYCARILVRTGPYLVCEPIG